MKRLAVLVKDNGGEGEVVGWYDEFWQALQAAHGLNSPYSIYVKEFEHNPKNSENYYCPGDCSMCGYAEDDAVDEEEAT